jgi:glycosyltransferase involved in cell wall biosynthesis
MLKVLHVVSGLQVGGAEMMLHRLILSSRGGEYSHLVVSLDPAGEMRKRFEEAGIELVIFNFRKVPISHFFHLVVLIRKVKPDIVQSWLYHADLLGGLAARLAGNRIVFWGIRTTEVAAAGTRGTKFVRHLCACLSHIVPHTIVCAADASRRAHIAIGYDAARMVVVPNGFDLSRLVATPEQRNELRLQCEFGVGVVVIGYLGRFHPDKDQANFVRAAGLLAQQHSNVSFLMVGRGLDEKNDQLTQWISATGCAKRFVLLGERDDVPVCLAAMDLFCLSSRTEGFPNVVAEAMAMGLPCAVTDVGDAAMLVAGTGVVVPKEDSAALAAGLGQLMQMAPDARQRLGEAAKARIHSEFAMDRARERFESIYQSAINREWR